MPLYCNSLYQERQFRLLCGSKGITCHFQAGPCFKGVTNRWLPFPHVEKEEGVIQGLARWPASFCVRPRHVFARPFHPAAAVCAQRAQAGKGHRASIFFFFFLPCWSRVERQRITNLELVFQTRLRGWSCCLCPCLVPLPPACLYHTAGEPPLFHALLGEAITSACLHGI